MMKVEVVTPEKFMGDVTGNLGSKRAEIQGMEDRGMNKAIKAKVPLAEMFGYISFLRSATSGRGTFTMEFARYAEVPPGLVDKLMEKEEK